MGLAAFNRRRRELAAKQSGDSTENSKPAEENKEHTVKGGQKNGNGKARKTKTDSGD